jgi:hypothetical protein
LKLPYYLALFIYLILQIGVTSQLSAQSFFSTTINGKSRSYLVAQPKGENLNQPLLIVLRSGTIKSLEQNAMDSIWQSLTTSSTLVFPVALGGKWNCEDSVKENYDVLFLSTLISEVYGSFHINRNKVYLISDEDGLCLSEQFYSKNTKSISLLPFVATNEEAARKANSFSNKEDNQQLGYELYKKTKLYLGDEEKDKADSIKMNTWGRRLTVEFHMGDFSLMNLVRTNVSDKTRMGISNISNVIGVQVTKWMDNSLGWYADLSYLNVASKEDFSFSSSGLSGELGFGFIVPLSFGLKYGFGNHPFRPYFLLGSGPMLVSAVGGRITSSGGGIPDPNNLSGDITPIIRITSQLTLGSGFDIRLSKRFLLSGQFLYIHSANFKSVGKIEAVKGFSTNLSIGFIFGANRLN